MKPTITVVTVVFNDASNIERTILSVINQTYQNFEYIIVDGGSTDGTLDIINNYKEKISCWISEPDEGIYDAMNKGVQMASGEYINFMNAGDNFCSDIVIDNMVGKISNETDLFYGDIQFQHKVKKNKVLKNAEEFKLIKKRMPFCHQAVFVKRKHLLNNPFDVKRRISADYKFFLILSQIDELQVIKIDEVVCNYNLEGISTGAGAAKENLLIIMKMFPFSFHLILNHIYLLMVAILYRNYMRFVPNYLKEKVHSIMRKS